jgi:hypothetical protein
MRLSVKASKADGQSVVNSRVHAQIRRMLRAHLARLVLAPRHGCINAWIQATILYSHQECGPYTTEIYVFRGAWVDAQNKGHTEEKRASGQGGGCESRTDDFRDFSGVAIPEEEFLLELADSRDFSSSSCWLLRDTDGLKVHSFISSSSLESQQVKNVRNMGAAWW